MPESKRLIVNADDYGLHPAVNQAVVLAHREGIVTSTTILAGGKAFFVDLTELKSCPQLGTGIHLCLVDQEPVLPPDEIPSLVDKSGRLYASYGGFLKKLTLGQIKLKEVRAELEAQIRRVVEAGLTVTHFDSHQHLHLLPGISRIVVELGKKYNVRGVRIPAEVHPPAGTAPFHLRWLQGKMILNLAVGRRREFLREGLISPDYFIGFSGGGQFTLAQWLKLIPTLRDGVTEVMVHPGADTDELQRQTGWGYHWDEELQALTHPALKLLLDSYHVELINYGHLA